MAYALGIDLGTSCTVAAVIRADGDSAGPEVVALGVDTPGLPTVLHLADDGTIRVGAAAEPLVLSDPDRVFRGFLQYVGEPSGSEPGRSPAALTARLVRWVVDAVVDREGEPPDQVTLTHPVVWGPGECRAVHAALNGFGLLSVVLVPVPLAAATTYATQGHVMTGDILAVYDLGTTFSASILRRESTGFTLLGEPQVIEDGGGGRFDEAILARVLDELGDQVAAPDLDDEAVLAGMARLLAACVAAREALSSQLDVTVPVSLPDLQAEVQLTRDELEALIAAPLRATVTALRAAITTAQLTASAISTVVVTGGCAGMSQVAQMLTADLGRPLAVLTDPELAAARGAARLAAESDATTHVAAQTDTTAPVAALPPPTTPVAEPPPTTPVAQPPPTTPVAPPPPTAPVAEPPPTAPVVAQSSQASPEEEPTEQLPPAREFAETPTGPPPVVLERLPSAGRPSAGRPSARPRSRPRPRTPVAVAAGLLAATAIALPLALLRPADSGAESTPTVTHGDPSRGVPRSQPGSTGRPLGPADPGTTGLGPAGVPASSAPPPAVPRIENPLAPPPGPPPRPPNGPTNPPPGTPQPPGTTAPAPPPPPTSTTTPPPPPPPTNTTNPPPPPPTNTTNPPPPTNTTTPPPPTNTTTPRPPPPPTVSET